jgi:uncharacterized protein YbaR (Trm112 family)
LDSFTCPACKSPLKLDKHWKALMALGAAEHVERGHSTYLSLDGMSVDVGDLPCTDCKTTLDLSAVDAAAMAGATSYACTSCAASLHLRAPPQDWRDSGFHWFVGEDPEVLSPRPGGPQPARPVVFKCPNCNGALTVDGSSRAPECSFCHVSAFLPDELWHLFHPVLQKRSWSALFDESTGMKRRAKKRTDARDPATPAARLLALLAEDDRDLMLAMLENPGLPDVVQLALAPKLDRDQAWTLFQRGPNDRAVLEILKGKVTDDEQRWSIEASIGQQEARQAEAAREASA